MTFKTSKNRHLRKFGLLRAGLRHWHKHSMPLVHKQFFRGDFLLISETFGA